MAGRFSPAVPSEGHRDVRRGHMLFRAPSPPIALGAVALLSAALAALLFLPGWATFLEGFVLVVALPAFLGVFLTPPLARLLGGRFELRRSAFLGLTTLLLQLPLALIWRVAWEIDPAGVPGLLYLATFLAGPVFWFRYLSIYGVSRPSHARMFVVSILPVLIYLAALFALEPPSLKVLVAAAAFLLLGFACAVWMLRAADRPMRREFQTSGVALIRPMLDHVTHRDPHATRALEEFFLRTAMPADLKVRLVTFWREGRIHATVALPTVHPGPFAALGSSDLPRKFSEKLGPAAGTVLVPHTPSDHDLDLPSEEEIEKVARAARGLLSTLPPASALPSGPLVSPHPGSLARAQIIGNAALVLVSRAPDPTDDIPYAIADRIVRELAGERPLGIALIDAHNSYVEGQGDIVYGTPSGEQVIEDAKAAVTAALAAARSDPIEVGVAVRSGYSIGDDGIGPQGMRGLVIRAAGKTTGYLLIDGNNLVFGRREPIVRALEEQVDVAEVMTTDNHVVHEVDGGINPIGERYPLERLVRDAREVLAAARADLRPAEMRFGEVDVPSVKVLGPGHTARLLTSLGDTLTMFTNMFPATLLLLLVSSLLVTFALR